MFPVLLKKMLGWDGEIIILTSTAGKIRTIGFYLLTHAVDFFL